MIGRGEERGLTFLEIMIVVVIMGIMIAVVLPNMAGPREKIALQSAARQIAAGGLMARQMAIVSGRDTKLVFDPMEKQWTVTYSEEEERSRRRRESEAQTSEEQARDLPQRVEFAMLKSGDTELSLEEPQTLVFYPNGASTGMAVQVKNRRGQSLTVDFDTGTGRPEVYAGNPRSLAQKLRDMGLDPAQFGLSDDSMAEVDDKAGDGYFVSAGWNEEERVDYYKDAVERMLERSRTKSLVAIEGPGAYYSEAARWGGN